ncbi:hypothetical protein ADK52_00005 [Streptomyces sp. WM6372]|uniref:hypothetical protein n=1 Tax=Streptomyces sp. WM6372 TaxID=1415555 RepID=UPI0006ADB32E|nr:hypothetical protein [Streptomyces sp. WM6372]KOU32720.1 hypothetical protein ADK52_00005 [Streptomyces sp. WM6372]
MDEENPPPQALTARIKGHVGWWLSALGAIAGIIALYFAFRPTPDPPITMAEWRTKASSVCEKEAGPAVTVYDDARAALSKLVDNAVAGQPADVEAIAAAGHQYEEAGNTIQGFMGSLRDIEQPPRQAKQITEALNLGSDIGAAMHIAGRAIINRTPWIAKPQLLKVNDMDEPWRDQIAELKARYCAAVIHPPTPSPTATPSASGL